MDGGLRCCTPAPDSSSETRFASRSAGALTRSRSSSACRGRLPLAVGAAEPDPDPGSVLVLKRAVRSPAAGFVRLRKREALVAWIGVGIVAPLHQYQPSPSEKRRGRYALIMEAGRPWDRTPGRVPKEDSAQRKEDVGRLPQSGGTVLRPRPSGETLCVDGGRARTLDLYSGVG